MFRQSSRSVERRSVSVNTDISFRVGHLRPKLLASRMPFHGFTGTGAFEIDK